MVKYVAAFAVGGLAFWAIERFAFPQGSTALFGMDALKLEQDASNEPKLGLGYIVTGGTIAIAGLAIGGLLHKVTGGRVPAGLAVAGK
jgi:hypothetical protein